MSALAESAAIEAMAEKIARLERELERVKSVGRDAERAFLPDLVRPLRGRGIILLNLRDFRDETDDLLLKDLSESLAAPSLKLLLTTCSR